MTAMARLLAATAVALVALLVYGRDDISPEDFALRKQDTHAYEVVEARRITAASIDETRHVLDEECSQSRRPIAWFGNSQLHTINQMRAGEHLAPHWLRVRLGETGTLVPLGLSLPNANLQEHFVLAKYVMDRCSPKALILGLVFDDLREDELRQDFSGILSDDFRRKLSASPAGTEILQRFAQSGAGKENGDTRGLQDFAQLEVESSITKFLEHWIPLWAKRPALRAHLLTDLYFLRNAALGIKPTTVRKMISMRYDRNMKALTQLLTDARQSNIPVVLYVAPLRPDVPPPYDLAQYNQWKTVVAGLASRFGAEFANLEALVPADKWGTYNADDVDFMHFQGDGHVLLANALLALVKRALKES